MMYFIASPAWSLGHMWAFNNKQIREENKQTILSSAKPAKQARNTPGTR